MSDAQFMPTADEELYIPESVIESSATQEDLDIWIQAEVAARGLFRFWYSFAQIPNGVPHPMYQMVPCLVGLLAT